jgi:hypothetical protein
MKKILDEKEFPILIVAYRKSLVRRYSVENLKKFKDFDSIPRERIEKLISYFLEQLYPEIEKRIELDKAFTSLGNFIQSPEKLFGLIGSVGTIIFKFGKQFFSAAKAGVSALKSYLKANQFEEFLFHEAKFFLEQGKDLNEEINFRALVSKVNKNEAEEFRKQILSLFETLSNQKLLKKVEDVMLYVIQKMKEKPKTYAETDIRGIELGLSIIESGKSIFAELNEDSVKLILKGIDIVEKDFFENSLNLN